MRTNIHSLAVLLLLGLAACTNDEANDPLADGPVPAQVTAAINQNLTRISVADDGPASFTDGDKINVLAGGSATYVYAFDGNTWDAVNQSYYFQDRGEVTFRAWYAVPAVVPATGNEIDIDTKNQTIGGNAWNQWDILATPEVKTDVSSPIIDFTGTNAFNHVMTQVTMAFKAGSGISDLTVLTGYTLENLTTDATFNTLTCTLAPGTTTGDIAITGISASGAEHICTPLILVPQAVAGNEIALEVKYNGQTYQADLTVPEDGLQSGYSYTYTVTISITGLEVGSATINDWKQPAPEDFDGNGNATLQ